VKYNRKRAECDKTKTNKRAIERVQALADISRSALCCHSNETRAPITNPSNSAQLKGTPYHSPKLHPGPCNSVGMRRGADRPTHTETQMAVTNIYISPRLHLTRSNQAKSNESTRLFIICGPLCGNWYSSANKRYFCAKI